MGEQRKTFRCRDNKRLYLLSVLCTDSRKRLKYLYETERVTHTKIGERKLVQKKIKKK